MPLFKHRGHHGGRYDDPHGVTAGKAKAIKKLNKQIRKSGPEEMKRGELRNDAYNIAREQEKFSRDKGFGDPFHGSVHGAMLKGGIEGAADRLASTREEIKSHAKKSDAREYAIKKSNSKGEYSAIFDDVPPPVPPLTLTQKDVQSYDQKKSAREYYQSMRKK